MKLMTKNIEEKLSHKPLYSTEGQGLDAECVVKYFNPCGAYTFFATEGEKQPDGDWLLFGLCYNQECEWGYVLLSELESVKLPLGLGIERDLYSSGTVRELASQLGIEISSYLDGHSEPDPELASDEKYTVLDYLKENSVCEVVLYDETNPDFCTKYAFDYNSPSDSDKDKVMKWLAENIEVSFDEGNNNLTCFISDFVKGNYELFEAFCEHNNHRAYQMDRDNQGENIDVALFTIQALIAGGCKSEAYSRLAESIDTQNIEKNVSISDDDEAR